MKAWSRSRFKTMKIQGVAARRSQLAFSFEGVGEDIFGE